MNKIIYPAAQWINTSSNKQLCLLVPGDKIDLTQYMLRGFRERGIKYLYVEISKPRKPRTTGKDSQCNHFHGHCQQISMETGNDFDMVKLAIKVRAIKRGYPMKTILDKMVPQSEADADTIEESYLIDEAHQVADELGIRLKEEDE